MVGSGVQLCLSAVHGLSVKEAGEPMITLVVSTFRVKP